MDICQICVVILCLSIAAYTSAFILTTSSDRATAGLDFNLTCMFPYATAIGIQRRNARYMIHECSMYVDNGACRVFFSNPNFTCTCNPNIRTMVLTIPGTYVMDILHGSIWQCYSLLENIISNSVLLDVNVPVSKVTLTATQSDENPIKVVSGSQQRFICTTDASRPAARIQWYLSGTNITDEASPQPSTCSAGCETVISSSVLSYIGNITDIGKIIYCTAANVEGQSVNSTMRSLDILYEPLIAQMPNINILEGNFLAVNCNVVSNPDPTYVWWTRQKEPGFRLNNANLTIINIHRNNSDSYTCHVMNILTPAGMSPQERTSQKMFDVNVQYEPEISQIPDFNITEGRTLTINSTTEANPDPIMVWWTRQNVLGLRYDGTVLSISSMQRQQSDIYTFHAMNILTPSGLPFQNRTSRKSFQINVQYPPTVNMYPGYNPYILYEGQQKIKLTCVILDANPTIDIIYNWTNAGAPISGKVINIKHVMRNISGQYSCSAINMIGISNTIWKRLDVQYQPEISDIQDYNVTEGNTLIIFPIISANPQPSLFWWSRPNEPEVVYNSSYLKISNILRKSSGYHTFHVRNTLTPSGMPLQERTSKKMFHVNVQYQPAISEIQDYNITEGHDLQIYPVIDANPEPTLLWWTSQNSFTYYGNSLTFTNVQRNSSGNYTCHVMNTLSPSGKSQQNRTSQNMFNVNVQYPPIIADINDINIMEGSSLAIYPVIDANPQSTSVWWSRQSEPYFRFYDTNFTISNIQKQSSGSYIFNAMNILTPSGMQQQKRTSQKMCYVNVQYKPVLSGSPDFNIEEGSTLKLSPTIDANPSPTYIWWTRENDTSFIYYDIPLMIKNIKQIHSGRYIVNVMNTLTPSGMLETNLTSQKVYNINVTVSTGSIARDTSITSGNSVIIGAGVGAVVIFISIAVIGGLIFISRKRQINRRNEDSNDRAYDSTPTGPGQSSNREMHVYNDLENVEGEANKLKKNIDESSYEEIGDVKRIRTDNIYQNMTLPDNESQKQYKEKIIYENLHP